MADVESLGFVGLGTMGGPMCANLARKAGLPVYATDREPDAVRRLVGEGVIACAATSDLAERAEMVFLSLPNGEAVEVVCLGENGLLARPGRVKIVVDCGTSPVALTRRLAARLRAAGIDFADAPVARTREAAQQGRLSIMVGADPALFARIEPFLAMMGTDITRCGPVGSGQVLKILNNMVLFETVGALAEAMAVAGRTGVEERVLLETLSKGSADSFALRNHGLKAMLPRTFPENAFATAYALKDLGYALELAAAGGVEAEGALVAKRRFEEAIRRGRGRNYWPVIVELLAAGE